MSCKDYKIIKTKFGDGKVGYYVCRYTMRSNIMESIVDDIKELGITIRNTYGYWSKKEEGILIELGCDIKIREIKSNNSLHQVIEISKSKGQFEKNQLF